MAIVGELLTILAGNNTQLLASVGQSEAALRGYSTTASTHGGIVSGAFKAIGVAAIGVGAATVIGAGVAAHAAGGFQEQMAIINTIAGQTPEQLTKTGDAIRALSTSTGTPLSDLTSSFYELLSVGVPTTNAMDLLSNAVALSIGGISTTKEAVDAITTSINAWSGATGTAHLAMTDSTRVTDIWGKSIKEGGFTAADIGSALSNVAAQASNFNTPLEQVAATAALLTTRGFTASTALTSMDAAFTSLQRVPPGMQELQDKTGKTYETIARTEGIHEAIMQVVADADKFGVGLVDVFGRTDALGYVINTTGTSAAAYGATLASMYDSTGTASTMAEERMNTFSRQSAILGETFNNLLITVGLPLLPFLTDLVGNISGGIQAVTDWADQFPNLGAAMASLIPTTDQIGAGIMALGQAFIDWIGPMIPQAVAALGQLGTAIAGWVVAQAPVWLAQLQAWGQAFIDWIGPMIPPALEALGQLAGQVAAWIVAQAPGWLTQLSAWAAAFVDWIAPMVDTALGALGDLASRVITWIGQQDWAGHLQMWADAFITWIGPMVDKAIAALGTLATNIVTWAGQQVGPLMAAAGPVGKAILDGIIGALGHLAGAIGDAISNATKNFDASKIPGNLNAIFTGASVIAAVVVAGQVVGAAFAGAMATASAVVSHIKVLLGAALKVEQAAISTAVGFVGGAVGSAFQAAFSAAATYLSLLAGLFKSAMTPVAVEMATAMGPIGAGIGTALDAGIAVGIAAGPVVIAAAIVGLMTAAAAALGPQFVQQDVPGANQQGNILGYASGGWVGLHGPEMAIVGESGPEYIVPNHNLGTSSGTGGAPPGGNAQGGVTHIHNHINVQLNGETIGRMLDEMLFNHASGTSSGFAALPGTTGA